MGKPTGFLEYERIDAAQIPPAERIRNFQEFKKPLTLEEQSLQGARCMECGVPFCQAGQMIAGMASGCPLHNLDGFRLPLAQPGAGDQRPGIPGEMEAGL